jgi:hypothetical protein
MSLAELDFRKTEFFFPNSRGSFAVLCAQKGHGNVGCRSQLGIEKVISLVEVAAFNLTQPSIRLSDSSTRRDGHSAKETQGRQ